MNTLRYVKVALFFIILGGAGTVYVVMSSDGFTAFNTRTYEAMFQDATGLSTRSKVYMAGVPVGKVKAIQLDDNTARVSVALLRNVEVRQNASLSRKSSSILGTSILSLEPGTELTPILPPGGTIRTEGAVDMNALIGTATDLGAQISRILEEFQQRHLALLAISLETFNSIASKIDDRLDDELYRVSRILESAASIAERTDYILATRQEDISLSLLEIRLAMENIRQISDQIAQGKGNIGQAVYDDKLYNSLLSTVEQTEIAVVKLQGVLDGAGEFIGRANSIGIMVDTRANYGFNSNNVRAGASLRLEPSTGDRWYRIGINSAPDGINSRTVTTTSSTTGGVTTTTSTDETETKYTYSIDAELARRFGILTIRGGILESTAGFGLDVQPLRWATLSAEVFNFRKGNYPTLRGTATIYPFFNPNANNPLNWIYISGGVYDALNARRDFFLGGGLRFSDREIKGLLGLVTTASVAQ